MRLHGLHLSGGRAPHTAAASVLDELGLFDARRPAILEPYRQPLVKNARDTVAGEIRPAFRLRPAGRS